MVGLEVINFYLTVQLSNILLLIRVVFISVKDLYTSFKAIELDSESKGHLLRLSNYNHTLLIQNKIK